MTEPSIPPDPTDLKKLSEMVNTPPAILPKHAKKSQKKTIAEELAEREHLLAKTPVGYEYTDEEIVEHPPKPTFYNSQEGSRYLRGTKYYDGDKLPDGSAVSAPILTVQDWAKRHETFMYWGWVPDRRSTTGLKLWKKEPGPARLNKLDLRIHKAMEAFPRLLIRIFRGSHKSTDFLRDAKMRVANTHDSISYFSYSGDQVTEFSGYLRDTFTRTPSILRDYGFIIDEEMTNRVSKTFWVPFPGSKLATRQAGLSVGSTQGIQRTGGHPDDIYVDDPESESLEDSEKEMKNLLRWWTKQVMPMAQAGARIYVAGTPKAAHDLLKFIEESNMFQVLTIRAIEAWPNGGQTMPADQPVAGKWYYTWYKPEGAMNAQIGGVGGLLGGEVGMDMYNMECWPLAGRFQYYFNDDPAQGYDNNRMSMQEFLLKRQEIGIDAFESEFQMNAVQIREGYLGFQNLRLFEWDSPEIPDAELLHDNCCAFLDQAFGDSNRADKNVISVVSEYDDNYFICELVVWGGGNVFTKVEMIKCVFKRFPWITVFGVEAGEANAEDMRTIQEMLPDLPIEPIYQNNRDNSDADGITFPKLVFQNIAEIPSSKRAKVFRIINQFSTTLPQGHFWMFQGIGRDQEELRIKMGRYYFDPIAYFKDQWSFPFCAKFDAVDSVGSAKEMCQKGGGIKHLIWMHG